MDDLISRKALMDYTLNQKSKTIDCNDIARFPAVEAEPVRHGRWLKYSGFMPIYRCSICDQRNLFKGDDEVLSPYCPNCGAKMDMEV